MTELRPWILIPIFDHGDTITAIVDQIDGIAPCLIVDDGSGAATRVVLEQLAESNAGVEVHRVDPNGGKGAALRCGFRLACEGGATHVIHLDADGQHELADLPRFIEAIRAEPEALILGKPIFDDSVDRARLYARQVSRAIVWLCTYSFAIDDPLCGYRAVPLASTLALLEKESLGDRMEFEPGLAVTLYWAGVPVRNLPTRVRYLPGGLSHFDGLRDTLRMARLYTRLLARSVPRMPGLLVRAWSGR